MRITVDKDNHNRINLRWTLFKGRVLIGRTPDRIYKTRKGYHLIWDDVRKKGIPITEEQSMRYRKLIGDDRNRLRLDSVSDKRLKQVLFCQKDIFLYEPAKSFDDEKKLISHETYYRRRIK
jgi:hypothetical protein